MKKVIEVTCASLLFTSQNLDWESLANSEDPDHMGFEELVTEMMELVAKCINEPKFYQEIFV